jgi:hypothetical protein
MKRLSYILFLLFVGVVQMYGQVDKKDVRKGNRDFRKENWREAEIDYRKALVKDSLSVAAAYNLANTLYRENDAEQAQKVMETVKDIAPASAYSADYYYNLGDLAIARQDWQGAVNAFKESLLRNPGDLDAKENYIYAKKKLEDQQNQDQQNQDQQNQDQNQDQNQNQNQDQNQDQNQNDQNQNNDNNQNQNQQQQQQQGQPPKISPQAAQQMLQAIQAKEKETQDKVNKQKAEALKSRQKEKNW